MSSRCIWRVLTAVELIFAFGGVASAQDVGGGGRSPSAAEPAAPPRLSITEGRVNVSGENVPWNWLLEEIAHQADVALVRADEGTGERVSVDFRDVAVEEALRRLLAGRDAFFFYGVEPGQLAVLRVVWVYSPGRGRGLSPVPPEAWGSTKELEEQVGASDPETRADAIAALVDRMKGRSLDAVLQAMRDTDERVLTRALYAALDGELELPTTALLEALNDDSANVRFLALGALADHPDLRAIARRALSDPNAHVKARAQEMLGQLDAASGRRAGPAPK
jgi:hypothetical protein